MPTRPTEHATALILITILALICLSFFGGTAEPQPACTHYAAPTASGSTCTAAAPCLVGSWWPLAGPGKTLCLRDGTYTGDASMILPPDGLQGTAAAPITMRAEHDGQVLLDAQHGRWAVLTGNGNAYLVIEGINASNGYEALYRVRGSHNTLRRVVGWNGTGGMADSNIFRITGQANVVEDCAGWGTDSRKIFDGAQNGDSGGSGFRRCWGEWNDHPRGGPNPSNTYQVGYNSSNQVFENVIGTWDTTGDNGDAEGVLGIFHNAEGKPNDMAGTRILGSLFYARPGANFAPGWLVQSGGASGVVMRDVAAVLPPGFTGQRPFVFGGCPSSGTGTCTGNTCTNCLSVHDGSPSVNQSHSGWSVPQWREGRGLAEATGGVSALTLLPGLCREYVGGVLTTTPLFPWRMNQRIKDARLASGFAVVDVTADIERLLGAIPAACQRGITPPEPPTPTPTPTPGPHPALQCQGTLGAAGMIDLQCTPKD